MNHNQDTNPMNPYGLSEVAPAPFNTVVVPECRSEVNPRPDAWNPGAPYCPWFLVQPRQEQPAPEGIRLTEVYLLAWVKEITRQQAETWLDLSEKYETKVVECNRLQKAIASRDYETSRRTA